MKKLTWLFLSVLLVLVMVLASCQETPQTTAPTSVAGTVVQPTSSTSAPTTSAPTTTSPVIPSSDKPKYGGIFTLIQPTNVTMWDGSISVTTASYIARTVTQDVIGPDWAKGPAGTNEISWKIVNWYPMKYCAGRLAESWELPEPGKIIVNVRPGVQFALNPGSEASKLVNGRTVKPEDIVFSHAYYIKSPTSFISIVEKHLAETMKIVKSGPMQVTVTSEPDMTDVCWMFLTHLTPIIPQEVVTKYGNMQDWHNLVGTGPFMLNDYVSNASATLIRNPNYWEKNPVGPGKGDQLPYADTLKFLIMPDVSTQMAAMRTGKADWVSDVEPEDANSLLKTSTQLKSIKFLGYGNRLIYMRIDKADLPYKNQKVRQALQMAIDVQTIKNVLYGGNAEILVWPIVPIEGEINPYVPLDKMPASVQNLFTYNIAEAKKLLTDAGYGTGFTAKIICQSVTAYVDVLSTVKDMWAKIGVTLEIQPKEYGIWRTLRGNRQYEETILATGPSIHAWQNIPGLRGAALNYGYINDPGVEQMYKDTRPYVIRDEMKVAEIQRAFWPSLLEKSYVIQIPEPYKQTIWQPWIMNYHGERGVDVNINEGWTRYAWIDQAMKTKMQ